VYWLVQSLWIFLTNLPVMLALFFGTLESVSYVGVALFVAGFAFEAVADAQKKAFREQNHEGFIQHGLWSVSRHPNYFGEIVLQVGVALTSMSTLEGRVLPWLPLLAPLFTTFILTRLSGIPILEKQAEKRYGKDPAYGVYKKNTALLIPYVY